MFVRIKHSRPNHVHATVVKRVRKLILYGTTMSFRSAKSGTVDSMRTAGTNLPWVCAGRCGSGLRASWSASASTL